MPSLALVTIDLSPPALVILDLPSPARVKLDLASPADYIDYMERASQFNCFLGRGTNETLMKWALRAPLYVKDRSI